MRIAMNTNKKQKTTTTIIILTTITILTTIFIYAQTRHKQTIQFDGEKAYKDVEYQVTLGPRTLGSAAHQETRSWIRSELITYGWEVENQELSWENVPIQNIIGKRGNGSQWVIIGAHYDSRFSADRDPNPSLRNQPVPGANDGASGVAVLLELARCLPKNLNKTIWLVFFDAEDNGNLPGYDWLLGSRAFVGALTGIPNQVVVIDMIGDKDLNIYKEKNSDVGITQSIWSTAASLGYQEFIPTLKYRIIDDHMPFLEKKIPATDIIDFDYSYWHTTQDILDKISAKSLQIVGETLRVWLLKE